ncbi:Bifunctional polymyxin resistance protein ArnA [Fusobacterium necrophorum]|nr:formyltransferase family protein [Fusobacterium necrophorum]MBR8734770.1 Bifunctional polymyxin resistance protein ArnA [Fusobacterium necrophorum]MBR8790946.1 Bifunctional polymyxin resistance protein ArnA [Fusobacterium necrophorum]
MKNIIYFGFGKLGTDCLRILLDKGYKINYIFTHQENKDFSVDTLAIENKIPFFYYDLRKKAEVKKEMEEFLQKNKIDYLISINYRYIIPESIFSKVQYAINIHGSLLPKYRGRTPHVWNIINGEKFSGITCHKITDIVDSGDIIYQEKIKIEDNWTGNDLLKEMQSRYPSILLKALKKIENNKENIFQKQNEIEATYFGKRIPEMGYISFFNSYINIYNFIRAQAEPYPGAYYYLSDGKKIIIDEIEKTICPLMLEKVESIKIGEIIELKGNYYIKCEDAVIKVTKFRF